MTTVTEQASLSSVPVAVSSNVTLKEEVLPNENGRIDTESFPREK